MNANAVKLLFVSALGLALPSCLLQAPVSGSVTQTAGSHPGTDIGAPLGSPVSAVCRGWVREARSTPGSDGRGNIVIVEHDNGYQTQYWHLSAWTVTPGQRVETGQVIGRIGSTGWSTGPHLHFQLNRNGQLLPQALNDTFRLGARVERGAPWGGGLNPPLDC